MKRWQTYTLMGIMAGLTAGCGWGRPQAISHATEPKTVKAQILARMGNWQAIRADVQETIVVDHHPAKALEYQVTSDLSHGQYVVFLSKPTPMDFYVNEHETIWYPQSTHHYTVLPSLPAADAPLGVVAQMPSLLREAHVTAAAIKHNLVTLQMTVNFPTSGNSAQMRVTYNTKTNVLTRWQAKWGSTQITENFSHFQVNPSVAAGTYSFVPPGGVTSDVALSQVGTALNAAKSAVDFPIALPPANADMTLNAINIGTNAQGQRVVIMSFTAQDANPVVITEKAQVHALVGLPDKDLTATTANVGALTVFLGALPDNMEEAAFLVRKTEVIVEGETSVINTLLNAWGNEPSLAPST
ncbi:hypothetical protein BXT84_15050 [Sulfobacillus thermotolerans]|uniref:Outer membrane lipoprotein carrier protein LolA n=1 Tax=Sulfobacillus thermotolerans TaxID=338644 RepID=A0ABM6RUU4_9FIRM|nr:hypothetical protein BXT84_15050 [Sulfobacillus thermotolerans]